jgi:hypothetical protein
METRMAATLPNSQDLQDAPLKRAAAGRGPPKPVSATAGLRPLAAINICQLRSLGCVVGRRLLALRP